MPKNLAHILGQAEFFSFSYVKHLESLSHEVMDIISTESLNGDGGLKLTPPKTWDMEFWFLHSVVMRVIEEVKNEFLGIQFFPQADILILRSIGIHYFSNKITIIDWKLIQMVHLDIDINIKQVSNKSLKPQYDSCWTLMTINQSPMFLQWSEEIPVQTRLLIILHI